MIHKNEEAFTMIEILIVAVVIGIMMTIAIPRMDFVFSKDKLRSSTSTITSTLYLARAKAVNEGEDWGVLFSGGGILRIVRDPFNTYVVTGDPFYLEDGITINEMTFQDSLVVFTSFGQLEKTCLPSGSLMGSIILVSPETGDSTQVDVTYLTGRIREKNL